MLGYQTTGLEDWTRLMITVIEGSPSQALLDTALSHLGNRYSVETNQITPYIELPPVPEAYQASLDGGFRKKLRQRQRNIQELGQLTLEVYENPGDVPALLNIIETVERTS